jgi:hypothetical protein
VVVEKRREEMADTEEERRGVNSAGVASRSTKCNEFVYGYYALGTH